MVILYLGKTTLLPWLRNNVVYFTSCTCSNLLTQTLTKLHHNKAQLDIMELVDMSPPLVEEGKNYTKSTNWKSISIKHNNGESTMLDLVVVQAMSRKIVQTLPSIMQLHCPTSLVMSKSHLIGIGDEINLASYSLQLGITRL